jgi:hypothetical protein
MDDHKVSMAGCKASAAGCNGCDTGAITALGGGYITALVEDSITAWVRIP